MKRVLIVDKEAEQHQRLMHLLNETRPGYVTVGNAYSAKEGIECVRKLKPDLIFLNVDLPDFSARDFVKSLKKDDMMVILISSAEGVGFKPFNDSAVDCLLIPLTHELFHKAIEKFEHQSSYYFHSQVAKEQFPLRTLANRRIALPTLQGFVFREIAQIVRCESESTYTTFHFTDKTKITISRTLKECENFLKGYNFMRVHKSYLINLDYIKEYLKGDGGQVKMDDGSCVDISRRKKEEFLNRIQVPRSTAPQQIF